MRERYRLTRLFAQGGMAEVYLGVAAGAEGFEKAVAIKRILPHLARDEKIARMFLAEVKLATFLSHQNIVQVFDVGRGPDGLFIVMELVNGWDLGVVIDQANKEKTTVPAGLAAFVVSQAMAGLRHAYKQTYEGKPILMAHRDVSVSNILISAEGEVKVADFGIARLQAPLNRTEPGTFKGKIAYAAPEVIQGQPASAKSDQFASGASKTRCLSSTPSSRGRLRRCQVRQLCSPRSLAKRWPRIRRSDSRRRSSLRAPWPSFSPQRGRRARARSWRILRAAWRCRRFLSTSPVRTRSSASGCRALSRSKAFPLSKRRACFAPSPNQRMTARGRRRKWRPCRKSGRRRDLSSIQAVRFTAKRFRPSLLPPNARRPRHAELAGWRRCRRSSSRSSRKAARPMRRMSLRDCRSIPSRRTTNNYSRS